MNKTEYHLYVACLACYNEGRLVGAWIDADQDADGMQAVIDEMMTHDTQGDPCPHEETAIHDYEIGGIKIGEHESIEDVARIVEALNDKGEAFKVAYDNFSDVDQAIKACDEDYQGCHKSIEDWAETHLDDTGAFQGASDMIANYFDYARFARDCELGGDIWTARGDEGLHVFSNT